jgi:hypothetical protein
MSETSLQPIDLLIEARWVVPVEPHAVVLEDHAVAVHGDQIVALLPIEQARARYAPRERVELSEHALIPGLVNSHTHNPITLASAGQMCCCSQTISGRSSARPRSKVIGLCVWLLTRPGISACSLSSTRSRGA